MSTCRVMRPGSLGSLRRGVVKASLDNGARRAWGAPTRAFCVFRTIQDIHTGLRKAFELGESLAKSRLLPPAAPWTTRSRLETTSRREANYASSMARQTSISTNVRCYSRSAHHPPPSASAAALSEELRSVMRLLPHSVVVCTAMHGSSPRAMTMSSFTSLTLSPTPLITFNIAVPSRTLDAIAASREFNVHVLAGDAEGAELAHHFTRGNRADDVFDSVEWSRSAPEKGGDRAGAPELRGKGVLRVLRCRILADAPLDGLVRVRDHVIVVGEVLETIPGVDKTDLGLAYADRRYRRMGGELEVELP